MKHLMIIPAVFAVSSVIAAPAPTVRNVVYGGVESTNNRYVSYDAPFEGEFYVGLRGGLHMLNFSMDQTLYNADGSKAETLSDSYSFEKTLGFGAHFGYQFAPRWRAELDWEHSGKFEDSDNVATFDLTTDRIMLNAIWTMAQWDTTHAYLGLGGGLAMVESRLSSVFFVDDGNDTQDDMTYAAQAILGLEQELSENVSINVEYRLGYNGGMTLTRFEADADLDRTEAEIGGMLTNSVMVGLRFRF